MMMLMMDIISPFDQLGLWAPTSGMWCSLTPLVFFNTLGDFVNVLQIHPTLNKMRCSLTP
jgi:hypothetical protein